MKRRFLDSPDQHYKQPVVRCIDNENCEVTESEKEDEITSGKVTLMSRARLHSDDMIRQISSSQGVWRIMPPATAVLLVLTVILHMTIGGGAALRPQEQINSASDGVYQLAEYESQPYLDSDFNRNANELNIESTVEGETTLQSEVRSTSEISQETEQTETTETEQAETTETEQKESEETAVETTTEELTVFSPVDQTLYLAANRVNLRSQPDTSSDIIDTLSLAVKLRRTEVSDEWSFVTDTNGQSGYIMNKYLSETKPEPTPTPTPKPTPVPATEPVATEQVQTSPGSAISADMQQKLVSKARSHLGQPYVWANSGPSSFDCSGFTSYMYRSMFGIDLPRTTSGQQVSGMGVKLADIQIGDIICFDWKNNGSCDHVGFYVGGGQYVHASYSRGKVAEGTIRPGKDPIISVRRIIY